MIQTSLEEHTWTAGGAWISHKETHISPEDFASLQPDMWLTDGVIIAMVGLETDETETIIYAFDASFIWSSSQNQDSPGSCLSKKSCSQTWQSYRWRQRALLRLRSCYSRREARAPRGTSGKDWQHQFHHKPMILPTTLLQKMTGYNVTESSAGARTLA